MRKEYGKLLRDSFAREMQQHFPQFASQKVVSQYIWPGERAFVWRVDGDLRCIVILSPSPKDMHEQFTLQVGWSVLRDFPELSMRPVLGFASVDELLARDECVLDLPAMSDANSPGWIIEAREPALTVEALMAQMAPVDAQTARQRVLPRVAEAIAMLHADGMPFFERVIAVRRGV